MITVLCLVAYFVIGIVVMGLCCRFMQCEPHIAAAVGVLLWPVVVVFGLGCGLSHAFAWCISWIAGHGGRYNTEMSDTDCGYL